MSGEHAELSGPDFTLGFRRSEVPDGGMVAGHAHGKTRARGRVIDDRTGYVIDLGELRRIVEDEIISQLDHRHMNMDVPFLRGVNPTSENIVVACWHVLAPRLTPGRLTRLRLHETGNNYVEYDGQ